MNCKNKKVMIGLIVSLSVLLIFFIIYQLIKPESQKDKKDYFIISTSADLNGFDPTDPTHSGHVILNNIHDPFGKMIENEQISIPEGANPEKNQEFIFTLKKGLSFHNGDEVTIDDIKFSIKRGQSKENEKYKKLAINKIDELDKEGKRYKIIFQNNVVADDLKNIRILNKKAIEKEKNELAGLKIGTGPYMFEPNGYKTKEYVKLKQFKNYHKKDDLTNSYENIMFKISPDYDTNLVELEKGEIHAILNYPMPKIKRDKLEDESKNKLKNIKVLNTGNSYTSYIYINKEKKDDKTRKAIREALDIEKIVEKLGWGTVEGSPTEKTQNLEKTKNYLNQNPDKKKIKIGYFSHKKDFMSLYNKVVEQLRQAGFDVELTSKETNSFLHDIRSPKTSIYHMAFIDEGYELKQGEKIKTDKEWLDKNILIPLYKTDKYILLSKDVYEKNENQKNIDKLKNKEFSLSDIKK